MTYSIIYDPNYSLTIPCVLIDARAQLPIKNQIGSIIQAYTNAEVSKVVQGVIPYKIEVTETGVLVGFFTIKTGPPVELFQKQFRPAFLSVDVAISLEISNFITSGLWRQDIL